MARKKKPGVKPAMREPGRAVLDEDMRWGSGAMTLNPERRVYRGPVATETGHHSVLEVESRVLRAMRTLRSLPDKERRFFIVKSGHPAHVQEQMDAYASVAAVAPRFSPTPFDVSDYLTALSWARHLPRNDWRLIWWRSFDLSFGLIANYIGRSDETARRKYKEAITDVWAAANGLAESRAA